MTNRRIDEVTGTETVGHSWDGIEELDTPMPRWWVISLYISIVWAIGYVILYPAFPMLERASEGMLGWSSRGELATEIRRAEEGRAGFLAQLEATPLVSLVQPANETEELFLQQAVSGGSAAFAVNCIQCHGSGAAGSPGYPNLNDDDWLWGGDIASIQYTITNGIREPGHAMTRNSAMPPFAGAFDDAQMSGLITHVLGLRDGAPSGTVGSELYAGSCASCHGENGEGVRALGGPNLADAVWLYGDSETEIRIQLENPRLGMMPKWDHRLDANTIKMLAAFVYSRGGGEALETTEEQTDAEAVPEAMPEAMVDDDTIESDSTQGEVTEGEDTEA